MALHGIVSEERTGQQIAPALLEAHQRILGMLDEAYRARRLLIDHLRVLRFYGLKGRPPRLWVPREARAHTLWGEGLSILRPAMLKAGYVADAFSIRWQEELARLEAQIGTDATQPRGRGRVMAGAFAARASGSHEKEAGRPSRAGRTVISANKVVDDGAIQ